MRQRGKHPLADNIFVGRGFKIRATLTKAEAFLIGAHMHASCLCPGFQCGPQRPSPSPQWRASKCARSVYMLGYRCFGAECVALFVVSNTAAPDLHSCQFRRPTHGPALVVGWNSRCFGLLSVFTLLGPTRHTCLESRILCTCT